MRYVVKNSASGRRYAHAGGRTIMVPGAGPEGEGESEPVELNAKEADAIEEHPDLTVEAAQEQIEGGQGEDPAKPIGKMNKEELLAEAETLGLSFVLRGEDTVAVNEATNDELRKGITAERDKQNG